MPSGFTGQRQLWRAFWGAAPRAQAPRGPPLLLPTSRYPRSEKAGWGQVEKQVLLTSHTATCSPLPSHCPGRTDPASCPPLATPVPAAPGCSPPLLAGVHRSWPVPCSWSVPAPRSWPVPPNLVGAPAPGQGPVRRRQPHPPLLGRAQPQLPLLLAPGLWGLLSSRPAPPRSSLQRMTF